MPSIELTIIPTVITDYEIILVNSLDGISLLRSEVLALCDYVHDYTRFAQIAKLTSLLAN